jgi:lipid-binding SYLF domain-containing protein
MLRYLRLVLTTPIFLFFVACSTNPTVANGGDPELVANAQAALQELFRTTPEAQALQFQAKAVLVFPQLTKAGLIVGAEGGKGVMFAPDGKVLGYQRIVKFDE